MINFKEKFPELDYVEGKHQCYRESDLLEHCLSKQLVLKSLDFLGLKDSLLEEKYLKQIQAKGYNRNQAIIMTNFVGDVVISTIKMIKEELGLEE